MRIVHLPLPLVLVLVLMLSVGCVATVPTNIVEDGTLYTTLQDASASVLKDGRIAGSGAFIDSRGTFLTAAHVVHGAEHRLELLTHDGRVVPAEVVAWSLGADIVLVKPAEPSENNGVTNPSAPFTPDAWLALADTPPPAGSTVFVYGAPAMYRNLMLPGRIAGNTPRYNHQGINDCYLHSVNLAGPTPPGISGGCWVNGQGQIIGVQCSHIGSEQATTGMGFIAPLNDIRQLVTARADQPATTFGAQIVSLWSQQHGFTKQFPAGSAGVALHRLIDAGPAQRAGLPKDILITHVDGQPVYDINSFMDTIRAHAPGDTITLRTIAPNSHQVETYSVSLDELKW